jgi:glucose/arabinose dehydrogenase
MILPLLIACSLNTGPPTPTTEVEPVTPPVVEPVAPAEVVVSAADGAAAWRAHICLACHGVRGEGGVGPTLAGAVPSLVDMLVRVRSGAAPMPSWTRADLPDHRVAGIRVWLLEQPVPGPPELSPDAIATQPGVDVGLAASGLSHPTALAFRGDELYVATNGGQYPRPGKTVGQIWRVEDGEPVLFAEGLERPLGLVWRGNELIVSSRGRLSAWKDTDGDGLAEEVRVIIGDLPASGLHQNNSVVLGPDGRLYVGMGTASNAAVSGEHRYSGTILAVDADSGEASVYASGFRNPFGLAFAADGTLYATDNGVDPDLAEEAPEELDRVLPGGFYGHPYFFGRQPRPDGRAPPAGVAPHTPPLVELTPHASANGLVAVQQGRLPGLEGKLLVAEFGSYISRFHRAGRQLVVIDPDDGSVGIWASGFTGRPLALAEGPEGDVFVADFERGAIWRFFASDRQRTTFSPSFDCRRASTPVEHAICNDPQLAALDGELDAAYRQARSGLDEDARLLLRDAQRAWLRERDGCATDAWPVVCAKERMLQRLPELTAPSAL